jgi:diguanylate cyclase (GGDEF)-like protein
VQNNCAEARVNHQEALSKHKPGSCEACDEVRTRNYLNTEIGITEVRWLVLVFLFLHANVLKLPHWPLPLFNTMLVLGALFNFGVYRHLKRKQSFSVRLTVASMYLDTLAVSIAIYFTDGIYSSLTFIWYLTLFVSGVRFGFPGSLAFQVPISLVFSFLLFRQGLTGLEAINRLVIGLFSFAAAPLFGFIFAREERYTYQVMADIRRDSITDRLTGLFNYSYFLDELQREQARAERSNSHFSLIIFDLDFFKQVNDTYGHEKGNLLLKEVAGILKANARKMDIVARYGGEEFVVLMPDSKGSEMEVADRIRKKIEETEFFGIADKPIRITISGGVCTYPKDARSLDELMDKADRGLYFAKTCGRNRTSYCETFGVR